MAILDADRMFFVGGTAGAAAHLYTSGSWSSVFEKITRKVLRTILIQRNVMSTVDRDASALRLGGRLQGDHARRRLQGARAGRILGMKVCKYVGLKRQTVA